MIRFVRRIAALASTFAVCAYPAFAQQGGACFGPNERPSIPILENAPPPKDGQAGYAFYPASAIATMQLDALTPNRSAIPQYYWQWANHGPRRTEKGNIAPGVTGMTRTVAVDFSSPNSADACTLAQTAVVLGLKDQAARYAADGRLRIVNAVPGQAETTDVCIVPNQTLPSGDGVVLDYEVQDGRPEAESTTFLNRYASLVRSSGRKVILYTNPLDAPTQRNTGLSRANISAVAQNFDQVTLLLWGRNRQGNISASYSSQAQLLGGSLAKALIVFELSGTSLQDAQTVRQIALNNHVAGVEFWRNGAKQGGDCSTDVNRKIACVAFGRCTP
ncbi:hypothetical protein [Caulobacter sp. S45]|uniref:hypothetical protein n=1 Tax=Caulobacter sp. S45 TaxID=1641861 RepID=UPI0015750671|nr:hypothetical protein [Caulobacter sp. S45]